MQNAIDRDYVISHLMDVNLLISHYMFNFRKERKKSEKINILQNSLEFMSF